MYLFERGLFEQFEEKVKLRQKKTVKNKKAITQSSHCTDKQMEARRNG